MNRSDCVAGPLSKVIQANSTLHIPRRAKARRLVRPRGPVSGRYIGHVPCAMPMVPCRSTTTYMSQYGIPSPVLYHDEHVYTLHEPVGVAWPVSVRCTATYTLASMYSKVR